QPLYSLFFFYYATAHLDLLSFPTRRSSDLLLPSQQMLSADISTITNIRLDSVKRTIERLAERRVITLPPTVEKPTAGRTSTEYRSEEHTSELQSRENLVCRLLLEKKNNNTI